MPWMEGGAPVTIDTLLGQVKLGITHCAIALNPVAIKRAMFGRISFSSPLSRYAGSPPSMQTTTTGRSGQRYCTSLRQTGGARRDIVFTSLHPGVGRVSCPRI